MLLPFFTFTKLWNFDVIETSLGWWSGDFALYDLIILGGAKMSVLYILKEEEEEAGVK